MQFISALESRYYRGEEFDRSEIKGLLDRLKTETTALVEALDKLSNGRYPELTPLPDSIIGEAIKRIEPKQEPLPVPFTIPLQGLSSQSPPVVGSKAANLSIIKNATALTVPEGFTITSNAETAFLDSTGLESAIRDTLDRVRRDGSEASEKLTLDLRDRIMASKLPANLEEKLTPIQLANTFDLEGYRRLRTEFTTDDWLDFMVRSMGYESSAMERRLKMLFLTRLIPLCERNFNLVELAPRGTGKTYAVQELSPYAALLTGPTTVANLFGQQQGRYKGMVQIWDAIGFDEVADLQKMPKEVITMMKTYCESGQFQRGQEAMAGYASMAMFGNTQQPVDVMVQTGHLFAPMPHRLFIPEP